MASLQARHARSCKLGRPWTPFAAATRQAGCTCTPLYHVVLRHGGKLIREPVGHNRREAERALDIRRGEVARRSYRVLEDVGFAEWAERWLAAFAGKENTRRGYRGTLDYAVRAFGGAKVRDLTVGDVRRLLELIRRESLARRSREASPATLAKHLRQLGACLEAAVSRATRQRTPCAGCTRRRGRRSRRAVPPTTPTRSLCGSGRSLPDAR